MRAKLPRAARAGSFVARMNMPVIYITAVEVKSKGNANAGQSYPPLNAAVYKYPRRNDRRMRDIKG